MRFNTVKKLINHILICGNHIFFRKKILKTTKNWGIIYIDSYPFISTVFIYKNNTVKVKLHCPLTRDIFIYNFSSRTNIIDDHMLYLQLNIHTRETLEKIGYVHAKY